ncbi:ATP-grasp domain-containing protein [Gordonia sp. CPCC 205333]|uniref:ATP-grasp domain-containing protein n=1 Tax=Gordonia sp. CPCC 205333 TaxID=3140790 RepID=UPI003AF377F6
MESTSHYIAVTNKPWIAESLGAQQKTAAELPHPLPPDTYLWIPEHYAASAYAHGRQYRLTTTLHWPSAFDDQFLKRTVRMCRGDELTSAQVPVFVKLADAKVSELPAGPGTESGLRQSLLALGALDSRVIVSDLIDLVEEWRVLIVEGTAIDSSQYVRAHRDIETNLPSFRDIEKFATDAAQSGARSLPASYMLDVGITTKGELSIIEANPVWCANWYSMSTANLKRALQHEFTSDTDAAWIPDPILLRRVRD